MSNMKDHASPARAEKLEPLPQKPAYNPVTGCTVRARLVPSSNRVPPAGPQEVAMLLHTSLPAGVRLHPHKSAIRRPAMRLGVRLGLFAVFAAAVLLVCADARAQGAVDAPGYITLPNESTIYNFTFPAISGENAYMYELCVGDNGPGSCDIADVQVSNYGLGFFTPFTVSADGPGVPPPSLTVPAAAIYVEFTSYFWPGTSSLFGNPYTQYLVYVTAPWLQEFYPFSPMAGSVLGTSNIPIQLQYVNSGIEGLPATIDFQLGTTSGANDLYDSGQIQISQADLAPDGLYTITVPSLPANGSTVYATIQQFCCLVANGPSGSVQQTDIIQFSNIAEFQEEGPSSPPGNMLYPPPDTVVSNDQMFEWSTLGVDRTQFLLGTMGPGTSDLANSGVQTADTYNFDTISSIPSNGVYIYARVWYEKSGKWSYQDTRYTEPGSVTPAQMINPAPIRGTLLGASNVTFQWSPGAGPTGYRLTLGTEGPGSVNLYDTGWTKATQFTATTIPQDGVSVYARLYQEIDQRWRYTDYLYTEPGTMTPAALTTPSTNPLGTSNVLFEWTPGAGPQMYELMLGTTGPGSNDIFHSGPTRATSVIVPSIPANGVNIHAQFWQQINLQWQTSDAVYTESGAPTLAVFTSPTEGAVLGATNVAFQWSAGAGPTLYEFRLGTDGPCSYNLFDTGGIRANHATVPTVPAKGDKVYACLLQLINGKWQSKDSTYFESDPAGN